MQAAPNRDEYISINYTNIPKSNSEEFKKMLPINVTMFDTPYGLL